jgi:hypothetical protein
VAKKSKFQGLTSLENGTEKTVSPTPPPAAKTGKRDNPDYQQISAYIRKDTYRAVKQAIVTKRDLSDLIEELFTEWLKKQ